MEGAFGRYQKKIRIAVFRVVNKIHKQSDKKAADA